MTDHPKKQGSMDLKHYLQELKEHSNYDFCDYSDNSITRRLNKVMRDHRLTLDQLIEKTKTDAFFVEQLVQEITVNTTELFRDPEIWKDLYANYLPSLKKKKYVTIWHAGCSSGQEVFSNLILLNELGLLDRSHVYATDLNGHVLDLAKKGKYRYKFNQQYIENFNQVLNSSDREPAISFEKYFEISKNKDYIKVVDFIRKFPHFLKHDLVKEKELNSSKFDIIFCRNVLIYFNSDLQTKITQRFFNQLYVGGMLILGNHEGLNGFFKAKFEKNGPVFIKNNTFHFKY
jgi:chemotaxis protein methyltransferase CheR